MRKFFTRLDEKQNCWKILRKCERFGLKFNRKIEFLIIFGKFVTKNRAFGNNIIFLQQSFGFERGDCCLPPGYALVFYHHLIKYAHNFSHTFYLSSLTHVEQYL